MSPWSCSSPHIHFRCRSCPHHPHTSNDMIHETGIHFPHSGSLTPKCYNNRRTWVVSMRPWQRKRRRRRRPVSEPRLSSQPERIAMTTPSSCWRESDAVKTDGCSNESGGGEGTECPGISGNFGRAIRCSPRLFKDEFRNSARGKREISLVSCPSS